MAIGLILNPKLELEQEFELLSVDQLTVPNLEVVQSVGRMLEPRPEADAPGNTKHQCEPNERTNHTFRIAAFGHPIACPLPVFDGAPFAS